MRLARRSLNRRPPSDVGSGPSVNMKPSFTSSTDAWAETTSRRPACSMNSSLSWPHPATSAQTTTHGRRALTRLGPGRRVGELHRTQSELRGDETAHRNRAADRVEHVPPGHAEIVGANDVLGG